MNLSTEKIEHLRKLAGDIAKREGCVLYSLDASAGKTLKIYIDKYEADAEAETEAGASLEDCSNVSKGLSFLLDTDDVMGEGTYNLEVSTPGVERFLSEKWHYEKALNQQIKVRIKSGFEVTPPKGVTLKNQIKTLMGELSGVNEDSLNLTSREDVWEVPFTHVHSAKIIYEFNTNQNTKSNTKKR